MIKKRKSDEKGERERKDGKREERERKREEIKNGIKKLNMRIRILISYNFYVSIYNGKRLLSI